MTTLALYPFVSGFLREVELLDLLSSVEKATFSADIRFYKKGEAGCFALQDRVQIKIGPIDGRETASLFSIFASRIGIELSEKAADLFEINSVLTLAKRGTAQNVFLEESAKHLSATSPSSISFEAFYARLTDAFKELPPLNFMAIKLYQARDDGWLEPSTSVRVVADNSVVSPDTLERLATVVDIVFKTKGPIVFFEIFDPRLEGEPLYRK